MRHLVYALLILAMGAAFAFGAEDASAPQPLPQTEGVVRVGDIAPDFSLVTLDGKELHFSKISANKITILVFWSYFCFPCQTEMPELQDFYKEMNGEVPIVTIALDGHVYDKYVLPFIEEKKLTMPVAYDRETPKFFETAEKYGVLGTPTFFIMDATGRIRFIHLGKLDKTLLKAMVESAKSKTYCAEIVKPAPNKQESEAKPEASKANPAPEKN